MKAKASRSQLKRAARELYRVNGYLTKDDYTHADWPAVLGELIAEHGLHHVERGKRHAFVPASMLTADVLLNPGSKVA